MSFTYKKCFLPNTLIMLQTNKLLVCRYQETMVPWEGRQCQWEQLYFSSAENSQPYNSLIRECLWNLCVLRITNKILQRNARMFLMCSVFYCNYNIMWWCFVCKTMHCFFLWLCNAITIPILVYSWLQGYQWLVSCILFFIERFGSG